MIPNSNVEFIFSELPDPHIQRRREMLKKYPNEIRALMGNDPMTALWIVASVCSQFAIAYALRAQGFGWVLAASFCVGAFINHALYVFVHEATHNLVFKSSLKNRFIGMFCDFALVAPGAMAFRKYHLIHHNRWQLSLWPLHQIRQIILNMFENALYSLNKHT